MAKKSFVSSGYPAALRSNSPTYKEFLRNFFCFCEKQHLDGIYVGVELLRDAIEQVKVGWVGAVRVDCVGRDKHGAKWRKVVVHNTLGPFTIRGFALEPNRTIRRF